MPAHVCRSASSLRRIMQLSSTRVRHIGQMLSGKLAVLVERDKINFGVNLQVKGF